MNYINTIHKSVEEYFQILEPNYPEWLNDYIDTKEMLNQQYIGTACGTIYSDLYENQFFYSNLDHSIGVSLIVWHFTHDKKQTLSALFHDIATPAFKHSIDFLNDDYMKQESTESHTAEVLTNSEEITKLLKRDNISLEEIINYHVYPIADNDTPKLSADRLENSLSGCLLRYDLAGLEKIQQIYNDIIVLKDENDIEELGFQTEEVANDFVKLTSKLFVIFREDRTRYSMQLIADIIKKLIAEGNIKRLELFKLKEMEIIDRIKHSKYQDIFTIWQKATSVQSSTTRPKGVYYVHHGAKIRYINPLVGNKRISEINDKAKKYMEENLSFDMNNYVYLDFDF